MFEKKAINTQSGRVALLGLERIGSKSKTQVGGDFIREFVTYLYSF